jgi:hypothetical protein
MKKIQLSDITLEMVKGSQFGCRNCLWASCECTGASKFEVAVTFDGKAATCKAYTYYD